MKHSKEVESLLTLTRDAHDPTPADAERVLSALPDRLRTPTLELINGIPPGPKDSWPLGKYLVIAGTLLFWVGIAYLYWAL